MSDHILETYLEQKREWDEERDVKLDEEMEKDYNEGGILKEIEKKDQEQYIKWCEEQNTIIETYDKLRDV